MRITVLHVPGCPGAALLRQRLHQVLGAARSTQVTWQVVTSEDQARQYGMTGSPTLLAGGADPFARPGQQPSLSCRLYRDGDSRSSPAPPVPQLRAALITS
jgi:hypothetical protein